jgi:hypothetical protein
MSWLFSRERNILPLTVGQAILGTLVWWVFPVAWHHGMRVGPGFYSFHLWGMRIWVRRAGQSRRRAKAADLRRLRPALHCCYKFR